MKTLKLAFFITALCGVFARAQALTSNYSALQFNAKSITADGQIDLSRWPKLDFQSSYSIDIFEENTRRSFYPIGGLFFEVSSQNRINELTRRYEQEANTRKDLTIINSHVHYKGQKLKYSTRVYDDASNFDARGSAGALHGFRFGNYLIFLVRARMGFRDDPYDLVLYDLKHDTFAIHQTIGVWPQVWLFRRDEAVPDPRLKNPNLNRPNPPLNPDATSAIRFHQPPLRSGCAG